MDRSIIIILLCVIIISSARFNNRIVGGKEVDIEDFPFQISLKFNSAHYCGGSIISEKYVLTAAHCTYGTSESSYSVHAGTASKSNAVQIIAVKKIIEHPRFDYATTDYDFSILELEKSLNFNKNVSAIMLKGQDEDVRDGENCTVSGWGSTMNSQESNEILRATNVPKVNDVDCAIAYISFGGITKQMICAGYKKGGHDSCQGDSGGPLIDSNKVLVGVVSWGQGCAQANFPGVYAKISSVRDWILSITGI